MIVLCVVGLMPSVPRGLLSLPMLVYFVIACGWGIGVAGRSGIAIGCSVIPLVPVTHVTYGLGLWKGLLMGPENRRTVNGSTEPTVERVSAF